MCIFGGVQVISVLKNNENTSEVTLVKMIINNGW